MHPTENTFSAANWIAYISISTASYSNINKDVWCL